MKLCRNRLHPRPEVGICLACKEARRVREKLERADRDRKTRKNPVPLWQRQRKDDKRAYDDGGEFATTMRLLDIADELNRNPMPWDRERLVAERAAIMAQKQKVEA